MAIGPAAGAAESFEALRARSEGAAPSSQNDSTPTTGGSSPVTNEVAESTNLTSGTIVNTTA